MTDRRAVDDSVAGGTGEPEEYRRALCGLQQRDDVIGVPALEQRFLRAVRVVAVSHSHVAAVWIGVIGRDVVGAVHLDSRRREPRDEADRTPRRCGIIVAVRCLRRLLCRQQRLGKLAVNRCRLLAELLRLLT